MHKNYLILMKLSLCFYSLFSQVTAYCETPPPSGCFDFSAPVKKPLRDTMPPLNVTDTSESGHLQAPQKGIWGSARGKVGYSIQYVYNQLLDHYTIKDPKRVKLKVYPQEKEGVQDFHVVMVTAITPIMDIHWEENWSYVISEGNEKAPKTIVISYQKTGGTQYIPHLCGSIVLKALSANSTDVYLYEEVNALGKRSPEATVQGHFGTLATLRKQKATAHQ
jgi:hypothetical protein